MTRAFIVRPFGTQEGVDFDRVETEPSVVPPTFQEDVDRARIAKRPGDLRLLAHEAKSFEWVAGGLRLVGESQVKIGALAGARETFESLRAIDPIDVQGNLKPVSVAAAAAEMPLGAPDKPPPPTRIVLFTGHMLDAPWRPRDKQRFPPTSEAERKARELIERALRAEMDLSGGVSLGIAGAACGSDILFHEACARLGVPTRVLLALPADQFQVESVNRGGPEWIERYRQLLQRVPPRVLADSKDLPRWLVDKAGYDIWQRNNMWMIFDALADDARNLTLIALYNRDHDADGPGGTAHMVAEATSRGFKPVELDARVLLT